MEYARPLSLTLSNVAGAAMISLAGRATADAAREIDEAIGVLDAEAVVAVSLLGCDRLDDSCADAIVRYSAKRNGRLIAVADSTSQPYQALRRAAGTIHIVATSEAASIAAEALVDLAHRTYSNDA